MSLFKYQEVILNDAICHYSSINMAKLLFKMKSNTNPKIQ